MKTFFSIASLLLGLLGIAWLAVPEVMLGQWGIGQADAITVYMSRRHGGLFCGYATILGLARSVAPSPALDAILSGGIVVTCVMTIVSVVGVTSGVVSPVMWGTVVVELLLAAGFAYFRFGAR